MNRTMMCKNYDASVCMQCVNSSDVSTTGHRGYGDFPPLAPIGQHTCIFVNIQTRIGLNVGYCIPIIQLL